LTPERTEYLNQYSYRWQEKYKQYSTNLGLQSMLQYNLNSIVFVQGGLGYIPRTVETKVFFNQYAIPAPRRSGTQELVHARKITYNILQMPIMIGLNFGSEDGRLFLETGIVGNFLMTACYETTFEQYEGSYDKNSWLGHSVQVGCGFDLPISKKVLLTFGIDFTLENKVKTDPYLGSQDENEIPLSHDYNNGFVGIKLPLGKQ